MDFRKICQDHLSLTIKRVEDFPWEDKAAYAMWSAQTYYFVRHSTRLFATAAGRCPLDSDGFHFKYIDHLSEERGHEKLSIKDIRALGMKLEDLPELEETKALYQTQYYWIEHENPLSFYGYLLALEGLAVYIGGQVYQRVVDAHGEDASKFLKIHTEEDVDHLADVYKWLDRMDDKSKMQVYENLKLSSKMYHNILASIGEGLFVSKAHAA